jgi:glycosyltransferase involved in cell wall biosynthesis
VRLSVVIPANNEAGCIETTLRQVVTTLADARIDHEVIVVDDASTDGTTEILDALAGELANVRWIRSPYSGGYGFAVRAGLEQFDGDAVAVMMADGSDDPRDLLLYHQILERGYDCAFGSRFLPGATVRDYPKIKLIINRVVNFRDPRALPARLQRHDERLQGLSAGGDREHPAAALEPLQPHRRDAAQGGHPRARLRRGPDLVDEPQLG